MFTMSRGWEKFFYVLSWIFQGSSYLSPKVYGILHRMHHAYADTEKDPHSPKYDANPFAMMWRTKTIYSAMTRDKYPLEERFTKDLPIWDRFDNFADGWISRTFWGAFYIAFFIYFDATWWQWAFMLPIIIVMGPFHGAIINWFAHKYGKVSFKVKDTSKNLLPVDFLMLGESYHNNHHKFPGRPNFGKRWYEVDPVYPVIVILNALGIIKLKPVAAN